MRAREVTASTIAVVDAGDFALIELAVGRDLAEACRGGAVVGVLARDPDQTDPLLRRFCPIVSVADDRITVLLPDDGPEGRYLRARQTRDPVNLLAPVGAPHKLAPTSRRLLIVASPRAAWRVLAHAQAASSAGIETTLLITGGEDEEPPPGWLLPAEVEVMIEPHADTRVLADRLRWADEVIIALPDAELHAMRDLIARHRIGSRPLVIASLERSISCGIGLCGGCAIATRGGNRLACVDGNLMAIERIT